MKILRIITRLNIGGPSIQALDLSKELKKRGHDCYMLSGFGSKTEGDMWTAYDEYVSVTFTNPLRREINPYWDYYAFRNIRRKIKSFKPDIVHSHQVKAGALARLAVLSMRKAERPKTVHTYHGHTFHSYWGKTKGFIFRNIERFLNKRTDRIIAISQSQYNDLVYKYEVCSEEQTRIIPLGFDLSELLEIKSFDYNTHYLLRVGIIGRLNEIKNHELFFDFLEALLKEFGKYRVVGYIIGDGEQRKELFEIAKKRKLPIMMTGWQNKKQIINWYKLLDIVVCTSKNEGTPVSLIEAMAAGRLAVSTPVGGCVDLLSGMRGLLISDFKRLANDLLEFLEEHRYKYFIQRARQYVKENHQLDRLVDDIENLYEELL